VLLKKESASFLKKRSKKLLFPNKRKSFLVLFFKKEPLAFDTEMSSTRGCLRGMLRFGTAGRIS
jgi:hypothetical protein